jgi:hypothetical protein
MRGIGRFVIEGADYRRDTVEIGAPAAIALLTPG